MVLRGGFLFWFWNGCSGMFWFSLRLRCSGRRIGLRNRSRHRRHGGLLRPCLFLKFCLGIPLLVLEIKTRGIGESTTKEAIREWFDVAHEWIVRGFTDLTTPEIQKIWEREENAQP